MNRWRQKASNIKEWSSSVMEAEIIRKTYCSLATRTSVVHSYSFPVLFLYTFLDHLVSFCFTVYISLFHSGELPGYCISLMKVPTHDDNTGESGKNRNSYPRQQMQVCDQCCFTLGKNVEAESVCRLRMRASIFPLHTICRFRIITK